MTLRPMSLCIVVAGIGVFGAACASAGGGRRAACELSASDSVLARGRPLFRNCAVDRSARFVTNGGTRPDYRPSAPRTACYSTEVEFVVDATGKPETSTARVARGNDPAFGDAVLATLASWRYEPAIRDGVPVRQIVTSHQSMSTSVVIVPKGSSPPSGPPLNAPRC